MEENAPNRSRHMKLIGCPGCGQAAEMDFNLCRISGDLYVWFEGLCKECQHKMADPMPIVRAELSEEVKKVLSN